MVFNLLDYGPVGRKDGNSVCEESLVNRCRFIFPSIVRECTGPFLASHRGRELFLSSSQEVSSYFRQDSASNLPSLDLDFLRRGVGGDSLPSRRVSRHQHLRDGAGGRVSHYLLGTAEWASHCYFSHQARKQFPNAYLRCPQKFCDDPTNLIPGRTPPPSPPTV